MKQRKIQTRAITKNQVLNKYKTYIVSKNQSRTCAKTGKVIHVNLTFAIAALNRRLPFTNGLRIYRCPYCSWFHLTSKTNHYLEKNYQ